jgi:hypothetical protein
LPVRGSAFSGVSTISRGARGWPWLAVFFKPFREVLSLAKGVFVVVMLRFFPELEVFFQESS